MNLPKISAALTGFFADTIGLFIKVIISFILAFFIILEKDESKKLLREIEKSSLIGNYYAWCKPYFIVLADSFGETFKSQAIIALLNATLTIIGLYFLGINYLYAFWFIVFIFGFIPVFGMVISSVPIMLVAFFVGGFALVLKVMVLILLIQGYREFQVANNFLENSRSSFFCVF